MNREHLVELLRSHEPKLVAEGVEHLYLFGSFARGQENALSDIDIAFDVQPEFELKFSLIDQSRIQRELTAALNRKVDFVERAHLRPRIGASAAGDIRPHAEAALAGFEPVLSGPDRMVGPEGVGFQARPTT